MATRYNEKLFRLLEQLHQRTDEVTALLSDPEVLNHRRKLREFSQEMSYLKPLDEKYQTCRQMIDDLEESDELIRSSTDPELVELARSEVEEITEKLAGLEEDIKRSIVTDTQHEARNVFLEIRAGAGGNEASLFASDLLRMYTRLSELREWSLNIISTTHSAIGGIKEIILHIKGDSINRYLQFESGVHRVQRVPETESSGRIHTSTVTVAVVPEVEDVEVDLDNSDLRIDTFSASGPGGQHVNRTQSAIRITHLPTGLVVSCQDEKSQHKNKAKAMKVLKSRLFEMEKKKQEESISSNRKSQVGSGERSEKIRTYNFPQSRVTDHRVPGTNYNLETVLDGNLDKLFEELLKKHTEESINQKIEEMIHPSRQ